MEKRCAHCKETKPVTLFNKGRKSEFTSNCRDCCLFFKEKAVAERAAFKSKLCEHADAATKICSRCRRCKPVSEFNKGRDDDYSINCSDCAVTMNAHFAKYSKTNKGKATQARHQQTEKRKISKAKHKMTEKFAQTTAAYRSSDQRHELRAAEYERVHSDHGRHVEHGIGVKVGKMITGYRQSSETVMSYTQFTSRDDMLAHFESTFDDGMSFNNYGKHLVDGPRVWNVGHRIARFHFDANNPEDVKRCWMKQNLFAQWGKENIEAKVKLPAESELMQLRSSWPTAWNNMLPTAEERLRMGRGVFARVKDE